ncbi:MAG: exodeoxyribonuclease VII small subunit [Deltaproteobacteria bacterium]|nr:exodeoxyribonuclease VII small subunit [Deltaproteobacteria bacterium]
MAGKKSKEKGLSFEAQLARLTELTEKLEAGDLPLEEALSAYEEGMKISRALIAQLDAAEKRIEILSGRGGDLRAEPFGDEGGAVADTDDESGA